MGMERFVSESEAKSYAQEVSRKCPTGIIQVIESPDERNPEKRYVVDDADNWGFVRSWERLVATYENGTLQS